MSFSLGFGKTSGKQSGSENYTKTSTPNVPDWLAQPTQAVMSRIESLGATDPYSLIPAANPLQNLAATGASKLGDYAAIDKLVNTPAPTTTAESLLTNLESYYNPYRNQVSDAAMADFDTDAGRTRAAQDLALAGEGAFGGSGAALTKSLTEGELSRARNAQMSKLLSDMFTTSAGLSNQDAARRQAANDLNAQMALQTRANKGQLVLNREAAKRDDVLAQLGIGDALRGIEAEQRQAPFSLTNWLADAIASLNPELYTSRTETGNSTSSGKSSGTQFNANAAFKYGG
jgi:hypothetical protein